MTIRNTRSYATSDELVGRLLRARRRLLSVFSDLDDAQRLGHQEHHLEPPIWEMGHVAWFQESYLLRRLDGAGPLLAHGDAIFDSFHGSYQARWSHDFPSRDDTMQYAQTVLERSIARLQGRDATSTEQQLYRLAADHESMHTENMLIVRQALAYGFPPLPQTGGQDACGHEQVDKSFIHRDVHVSGGEFFLGAKHSDGYALDNEYDQHLVMLEPFSIANMPVTNQQFTEFVDSGGYTTRSLWTKDGWNWRRRESVETPLYWRTTDGVWQERNFEVWQPLKPWHPVCHINLHEARAYCRFAKRRLPSEAEWEMAASWDPKAREKRLFPWGCEEATEERAHLSQTLGRRVDVRAKAAGDSALGCRQMIGNVWEWTSSKLSAYPGFVPGAYKHYSAPYLDKKPVLRGGAAATNSELIRTTWRNFYIKQRRNMFSGIRTCALP